jgi:DNA-directed RNA polymerase subunit L
MDYDRELLYNADQKIEFLDFYGENATAYYKIFMTVKKYEERFDTDLCDFTYDRYVTILPYIAGKTLGAKRSALTLLTNYVNWTIANGKSIRTDNPLLLVDAKDINNIAKIRQELLGSPEHLQKVLDVAVEVDKFPSLMIELFATLLYNGFTEEEALDVEIDDVDFVNKIVYNHDHTKSFYLSDTLNNLLKNTIGVTYYETPHPYGGTRKVTLQDNNKLIRKEDRDRVIEKENYIKLFRNKLSLLRKRYYDETYEVVGLSSTNLMMSGYFYRLYLREKNGEVLDKDEFLFDKDQYLKDQWRMTKIKINQLLYKDWKAAFNLN